MAIGRTNTGGGGGLNFRIIGGTVQPTYAKENDIWVNTGTKIPSWYFGANEPNVYNIQPISAGDPHCLIAPHPLSEGDILNFEVPETADGILEAIRIRDVSTGKDYCVRSTAGEAVPGWYKGIKLCVMISNDINKVGDWGMHGTAYWIAWGAYYNKEGTVWMPTGTSSTFEFNALKKNGLSVCPDSCKQYIGGKWESMNACVYQGNAWVQFSSEIPPWDGTIYRNGTEETAMTGGLTQKPNVVMSNNYTNDSKVEKKSDRIVLGPAGYGGALLTTVNKVDLTEYNTLTIKGSGNGHAGVHDFESGNIKNGAVYGTIGSNTNLDISKLTGMYYITFGAYNTDNTYTCYEVYVN